MNKQVIRIVAALAVVFVVLILRWFIVSNSPKKQPRMPRIDTGVAAKDTASIKEARALLERGKAADAINKLEGIVSSAPGSHDAYMGLLLLAGAHEKTGNLLKARGYYRAIIEDYSSYCDYSEIQKKLEDLNMRVIFSKIPTKYSQTYIVRPGDTLAKIAKKYSTTVELIKKANALKSDLIKPEMRLKVQKMPFSVVVDKSQSTLTLIRDNEAIKVYTVSTGKNNSTPVGTFEIKNKLIDPVWYGTGAIVPPDSPENVLGTRWMGLTTPEPGYGIHGTIDPESIGYQCTEGCVRMHNTDVEELYSIIPRRTKVTIIN